MANQPILQYASRLPPTQSFIHLFDLARVGRLARIVGSLLVGNGGVFIIVAICAGAMNMAADKIFGRTIALEAATFLLPGLILLFGGFALNQGSTGAEITILIGAATALSSRGFAVFTSIRMIAHGAAVETIWTQDLANLVVLLALSRLLYLIFALGFFNQGREMDPDAINIIDLAVVSKRIAAPECRRNAARLLGALRIAGGIFLLVIAAACEAERRAGWLRIGRDNTLMLALVGFASAMLGAATVHRLRREQNHILLPPAWLYVASSTANLGAAVLVVLNLSESEHSFHLCLTTSPFIMLAGATLGIWMVTTGILAPCAWHLPTRQSLQRSVRMIRELHEIAFAAITASLR